MDTFRSVFEAHPWRPIPGCPGRYVLGRAPVSVLDLAGGRVVAQRVVVAAARDPVWVAVLSGGRVISYEHADGTFVHTLCDEAGFSRKLAQLGIQIADYA